MPDLHAPLRNRSVPGSAVIPVLRYADVRAAAAWLAHAFGVAERLRIGTHRVQLVLPDGGDLVAAELPDAGVVGGASLLVRVGDADAHHRRAAAAGARVLQAPTDQPYGERQYAVEDCGGHRWTFSETIADIDPASWGGELVGAPTGDTGTPAAVLLAMLHARNVWDYERVAALADPVSGAERFASYCDSMKPKTFEEFRANRLDVDEAEMRWHYDHWLERRRRHPPDFEQRAGVRTYEELVALEPTTFLARYLESHDERADLVRRLRARGHAVPLDLLRTPACLRYDVLGTVPEAPDLAHVLWRDVYQYPDQPVMRGTVRQESARRQADGTWRVIVDWESFRQNAAWILPQEWAELWGDEPDGPATPPDEPGA
jgi:uncharacterized glyoxalase superfamily protein PhnB